MTKKQSEPWYLEERARALAMVYLTRRTDLVVTQEQKEPGLDYLIDIASDDKVGVRRFGLELRASAAPVVTEEGANARLRPTMKNLQRLGQFPFPVCLFYFTMQNNEGFFVWVSEPSVTD